MGSITLSTLTYKAFHAITRCQRFFRFLLVDSFFTVEPFDRAGAVSRALNADCCTISVFEGLPRRRRWKLRKSGSGIYQIGPRSVSLCLACGKSPLRTAYI